MTLQKNYLLTHQFEIGERAQRGDLNSRMSYLLHELVRKAIFSWVAEERRVEKQVQDLLEAGADVNERDDTRTTPLGYCVEFYTRYTGECTSHACLDRLADHLIPCYSERRADTDATETWS